MSSSNAGAHPRGAAGGLQPPQTPQNRNLKDTDFVDISEFLSDLPFSRKPSLNSDTDKYIRILKINE
jgi:hypothetical protein